MRIEETVRIDAPAEEIWGIVTDPEQYTSFAHAITLWEPEGDKDRGLGARYRIRMRAGSAEVGGLVEIVEWDERSIADAIRRQARHEDTTRWDTIDFKLD